MRIALDARTMLAPRPRGTGRNLLDAYRLIPQLRPDWEFVLYHQRPLSTPDDIAGDRGTVSAWRWSEAGATVAATLESASPWRQPNVQLRRIDLPGDRFDAWFHVRLPVALRRDRPDLVHFPANAAPAWCPVPFVVTVHDLIPLMLAGETPAAEVHAFERGLCRALRRAAHVITPSAATRAELHERFGVPLDGMTVIPWAADTHIAAQVGPGGGSARGSARDPARVADLRARLGLGPRWLVLFAGGTPRKNAAGALAAFARVPTEIRREIQLVLVGCEPAERRAALVETAERLGLGGRGSGRVEASGERPPFGGGTERAGADGSAGAAPCPTCGSAGASPSPAVVVLGFVPHADLPGLLANSCGLLMPSRCEGFGLPMLDAFAAGVPVLTSACSSMPEVAGDAAVYCDPEDPESIAAGIGQLLEPERAAALVERGRARLSLFTWERTAEAMCAVYERAVLGVCSANRVAGQAPRPSRRTWPAEVHA